MNETPAEQELRLAIVRSQLGNARQLRIRELRNLFPLKISLNGIEDTICGHRLPLRNKETTATVELMRDWGIALGCAAHLISTAAIIYGCTLPHPLLLSGSRCCVLTRPGLSLTSVITPCTGLNDVKFPLYCTKVTDRLLMLAGIQLIFEDVASLAKVMGRHDIALEVTEGDSSLGAILNKLLLPM